MCHMMLCGPPSFPALYPGAGYFLQVWKHRLELDIGSGWREQTNIYGHPELWELSSPVLHADEAKGIRKYTRNVCYHF